MDNSLALQQTLYTIGIVGNILSIIIYLLFSWGLYMISKKLGDENPWLAWIPLVQYYTLVKTGQKSGWWVLWIFLGLMFFVIPGLILLVLVFDSISKRCGRGVWTTIGFFFIGFIMFPVVGHSLNENIKPLTKNEIV